MTEPAPPEENMRDRILRCAIEIVRRDEGELSAREVARNAGVNPAMINYHFGNRDGLMQEVVESYYTDIRQTLSSKLARLRPDNLPEVFEEAIRDGVRYTRSNRAIARTVLLDFVRAGHMRDQPREKTEDPMMKALVTQLVTRLGIPESEIRFRIKSLVLLIGRYAVVDDDELGRVANCDESVAVAKLEDHIVGLAKSLLLPPTTSSRPLG